MTANVHLFSSGATRSGAAMLTPPFPFSADRPPTRPSPLVRAGVFIHPFRATAEGAGEVIGEIVRVAVHDVVSVSFNSRSPESGTRTDPRWLMSASSYSVARCVKGGFPDPSRNPSRSDVHARPPRALFCARPMRPAQCIHQHAGAEGGATYWQGNALFGPIAVRLALFRGRTT